MFFDFETLNTQLTDYQLLTNKTFASAKALFKILHQVQNLIYKITS